MPRPKREFFAREPQDVARDVLGAVLVRRLERVEFRAKIVEVEAYGGEDDPASHAYRGLTKRTSVMFGEAGHAYVYFTYGNHYCLNVTTDRPGKAGAVLIRGVEPLKGIEEMRRRRGLEEVTNLTSGPGKLTKAMGIDGSLNGEDMVTSKRLYLVGGETDERVLVSRRIGISVAREREWRYYIEGNEFVSGARTHNYRTRTRTERGVVG